MLTTCSQYEPHLKYVYTSENYDNKSLIGQQKKTPVFVLCSNSQTFASESTIE